MLRALPLNKHLNLYLVYDISSLRYRCEKFGELFKYRLRLSV